MKVFISWSGERSKIFAQALHEWLPLVLQSVVPWLSQADIAAGERWPDKIAKELEDSNFGILSVTRENIASPWILFEAGALAKRMQDSRVIPVLFDIDFKDITGPLSHFQSQKAEREGLLAVISSINELSDIKLSDAQLPRQFDALWPNLEKQIGKIPKNPTPAKQQRPQQEILEELVSSIRGLDLRLRGRGEEALEYQRRAYSRVMREFLSTSESFVFGLRDPLRFLITTSFMKDDIPWLYQLAVDAYHETLNRSPRAEVAQQRVLSAVSALRHHMPEHEGLIMTVNQLEGWRQPAMKKGEVVACEVLKVKDDGIDVKIVGTGLTTFIKRTELARNPADQRPERFAVGQKVDARVTVFDHRTRKIHVSIKGLEVMEEKEAIARYGSADSGASLRDILDAALRAREATSKVKSGKPDED